MASCWPTFWRSLRVSKLFQARHVPSILRVRLNLLPPASCRSGRSPLTPLRHLYFDRRHRRGRRHGAFHRRDSTPPTVENPPDSTTPTRGRSRGDGHLRGDAPLVSAEVLPETNGDWAYLKVIHCNVIDITPGRSVPVIFTGEIIKRSRKTIMKGELERLQWSNESARALVSSIFMGISEEFDETAVEITQPPRALVTPSHSRSRKRKPSGPRLTP